MAKRRARVTVRGQVQGVWFRQSTKNRAQELNLAGWVRNNPDGSVEALFEGEETAIQKAVEWCQKGPDRARVDDLQLSWEPTDDTISGFRIR
jgi:acylphosphatase